MPGGRKVFSYGQVMVGHSGISRSGFTALGSWVPSETRQGRRWTGRPVQGSNPSAPASGCVRKHVRNYNSLRTCDPNCSRNLHSWCLLPFQIFPPCTETPARSFITLSESTSSTVFSEKLRAYTKETKTVRRVKNMSMQCKSLSIQNKLAKRKINCHFKTWH